MKRKGRTSREKCVYVKNDKSCFFLLKKWDFFSLHKCFLATVIPRIHVRPKRNRYSVNLSATGT